MKARTALILVNRVPSPHHRGKHGTHSSCNTSRRAITAPLMTRRKHIRRRLLGEALVESLQRTLDFAVGRSVIGVPKDGRYNHCTGQREGEREGYEDSFHREA
jgi:hypothetical protein